MNQLTDLFSLFSLLPHALTLSKKLLWNNKNDPMFGMAGGFFSLISVSQINIALLGFSQKCEPIKNWLVLLQA